MLLIEEKVLFLQTRDIKQLPLLYEANERINFFVKYLNLIEGIGIEIRNQQIIVGREIWKSNLNV